MLLWSTLEFFRVFLSIPSKTVRYMLGHSDLHASLLLLTRIHRRYSWGMADGVTSEKCVYELQSGNFSKLPASLPFCRGNRRSLVHLLRFFWPILVFAMVSHGNRAKERYFHQYFCLRSKPRKHYFQKVCIF